MFKLEGVDQVIVFLISGQRFGIRLTDIRKIIRAVEITPVPDSPDYLCGIIDMHGVVIPVMNMHVRIGVPDRPTMVDDRFIIANSAQRVIALRVDEVSELIQNAENQFTKAETISSDLKINGIVRSDYGLILIYNLETFLLTEEIDFLDNLVENKKSGL